MLAVFDIGGSRIRAARSERPGMIAPVGDWPTPGTSYQDFVGVLNRGLAAVGGELAGAALSIAGGVDPDSGVIRVANIPCLDGRALAADLAADMGCPVVVANDADCFALAEAKTGAGAGKRVVFGVILGTGVGGGLVIDGHIHQGVGGFSGEWGHGPVLRTRADHERAEVPRWSCGCGQAGCVDTVGGARGLERLDSHLNGGLRRSEQIVAAWQADDIAAGRTIRVWLDLVSAPLAMVVNVIGPSVVPVGGGLANVPALVTALDREVRARVLRKTSGPLLVQAWHRQEPGLIGASLLGFEELACG